MTDKEKNKMFHEKWKAKNLHRFKNGRYIKNQYPEIVPLIGEIFKEYKGRQVSNFGRVFNKYGRQIGVGKASGNGYHYIGSKKRSRIVYELFKGPIPIGLVINHIDGNKINDHIDNLEAVTMRENNQHAIDTKLRTPFYKYTISQCKLAYEMMVEGKSNEEIINQIGISEIAVYDLRKGTNLGKDRLKLYNLYKDKFPNKSPRIYKHDALKPLIMQDIQFSNLSILKISKKHNVSYTLVSKMKKLYQNS